MRSPSLRDIDSTICQAIPSVHYSPLTTRDPGDAPIIRASVSAYLSQTNSDLMPFTPDTHQFIIDTGASITITSNP